MEELKLHLGGRQAVGDMRTSLLRQLWEQRQEGGHHQKGRRVDTIGRAQATKGI